MKTTDIIAETGKRIEAILAAREKELALLDALIKTEEEEITGANHAMAEATAANSIEEYRLAKAHRESAKDAREMHEARRAALMNQPLITGEEYSKVVEEIKAAVSAAEDATKGRLCELANEMDSAASALDEVSKAANDVLHRWQHTIYRDADRAKHPKNGEPYLNDDKRVNVQFTVDWGRRGVRCAQYEAYADRSRG